MLMFVHSTINFTVEQVQFLLNWEFLFLGK